LISGTSSFKNKEKKEMAENSERGEKYLSNKKGRRRGKAGMLIREAKKEVNKKAEEEGSWRILIRRK
jgi:hypothetical protein